MQSNFKTQVYFLLKLCKFVKGTRDVGLGQVGPARTLTMSPSNWAVAASTSLQRVAGKTCTSDGGSSDGGGGGRVRASVSSVKSACMAAALVTGVSGVHSPGSAGPDPERTHAAAGLSAKGWKSDHYVGRHALKLREDFFSSLIAVEQLPTWSASAQSVCGSGCC